MTKKIIKSTKSSINYFLKLAIKIFEGNYHRKFLYKLISSQLDIDRLDYLKRDSFYSGVAEGNINSDRLIAMLYVVNDELVLEEKGIYSAEKFIVGRRLMYWQVYLHKTGLVAEKMLVNLLRRANELSKKGEILHSSKAFNFFLLNEISKNNFDVGVLKTFAKLDDYDIYCFDSILSMKEINNLNFKINYCDNLDQLLNNCNLVVFSSISDSEKEMLLNSKLNFLDLNNILSRDLRQRHSLV